MPSLANSETEPMANLNARISKDLYRRVRLRALEEQVLLKTFITDALTEFLRKQQEVRRG